MCNILYLKPGQMIPQEDFWNMCYNNWHSYGLVTRVDGKLDIIKKVPESGEIDPQEVWDLVKRDLQYERILHVRHNTAGATTLANAHPVPIYYDPTSGKHIEFMHNGTLYQFVSKKMDERGISVEDKDGPSDTVNFATEIIQPLVSGSNFGTGKGDIHNPFFRKVLGSFWPSTSNRGVLIANDQAPLFIGDWKKIKAEDESDVVTANTDYFTSVSRGPEFTRREAARKKAASFQSSSSLKSSTNVTPIVSVDSFRFGPKDKAFQLPTNLKNIFNDWNIWSREGLASLACATKEELVELISDKEVAVTLLDRFFTDYYQLVEEHQEVTEEKHRATLKIAELVSQLKELEWKDAA